MTRPAVTVVLATAAIAAAALATIGSDTDRPTDRPTIVGPRVHMVSPHQLRRRPLSPSRR